MAKTTVNLCVYGVPPPPYIKEWRRGGPAVGVKTGGSRVGGHELCV